MVLRLAGGEEASNFERLAAAFLAGHRITGVSGVEVTPSMRALIASSAVMLVFGRPDWEYDGLGEILIYPGSFADDGSFELTGRGGGGASSGWPTTSGT